MDLHTRKIVGWSMRDHLRAEGALAALQMAVQHQKPGPGLIQHSDRGVQYACSDYGAALERAGITPSMSRLGNCLDNTPTGSFFHTFKTELMHHRHYGTHDQARRDVFAYIEGFYNRTRLRSALGYRTPQKMELRAANPSTKAKKITRCSFAEYLQPDGIARLPLDLAIFMAIGPQVARPS